MPAITLERMKKFAPRATSECLKALTVFNADALLIEAGIDTPLILQHFMGQIFVESGGFTTLSENLHYSAARLRQVWPSKFPSIAAATPYAGNPERLADYVYGGRMGNNKSDDGWKYRGSGLLQMTGRYNFSKTADQTGLDLVNNPDLARSPDTALKVATLMWKMLGCNLPASEDDGERVTQLVNGGQNGASERAQATDRASKIFTEAPSNVSEEAPVGLLGDYDDAPDAQKSDPVQVPLTMTQIKTYQKKLKDLGYSPGEIDGNINSASTVGAICELQKQQGLPVTGIVDETTEDAIQNAPRKTVTQDRANETAASLRAKGSTTIASAEDVKNGANGVITTGAGLVAVSGGTLLQSFNESADQLKQFSDHIPGLSDRVSDFIVGHWQVFVLLVFAVVLLYLAKNIHKNSNTVINERVRKSRTGEDMSH